MKHILSVLLMLYPLALVANEVEIKQTEFHHTNGDWTVHVTLKHADTGWQHYADAWRIVDENGKVLGTRTLYHPHEHEQPFTRSLSGVQIPEDTSEVYIEAHDKVHGWSKDRLKVDLDVTAGERFKVQR